MSRCRKRPCTLASIILLTSIISQTYAASLLIDLGSTSVLPDEANYSMAHFAGAVPTTEISWNILTADSSSLSYSDGTTATGVSVDLGRSTAGNPTINFNDNGFTVSALGGQMSGGIYTNTSPAKDGIFGGSGGANALAVGVRIDGLPAALYTVYISGRNTSTAFTAPQRFFCTNGPSAATFAFSTNANSWTDEANSGTTPGLTPFADGGPFTNTFAFGDNCALLTVTLGAGDSLFLAALGLASNELRGFLNSVEIVPGAPVLTNFPALIVRQPTGSQTVYEGANVTIANVRYAGAPPLSYQWRLDGTNIASGTGPGLIISNITANLAGNYSVLASNSISHTISSNSAVTVIPLFNTGQMANIWNLTPGSRFYITVTNNTSGERGLAYNRASGNLLVVCQLPSNNIVVLDPASGSEKYFLNLTDVPAASAGVNMIGVAGDGVVYTGNATVNAGGPFTPYSLWQWANDNSSTVPIQLFSGDPGFNTDAAGLRWGDNLAIRGAGADTQILIAPGTGTNVCLFTTGDGFSFAPSILSISDVPSGFAQFGLAFGPETNTFWAKSFNQSLYLVQFDILSLTGSVLKTFSATNGVPNSFRFISTDQAQKWMGGIVAVGSGLPDHVRLYDISNLTNGPVLADQELYSTANPNNFLGSGTGSTAFGGNYLFALDSQNGIKAFLIDTNFSAALPPFKITSFDRQSPSSFVLTWQTVVGHNYQVQFKDALTDLNWSDASPSIMATGTTTSLTNNAPGQARFYRVQGH